MYFTSNCRSHGSCMLVNPKRCCCSAGITMSRNRLRRRLCVRVRWSRASARCMIYHLLSAYRCMGGRTGSSAVFSLSRGVQRGCNAVHWAAEWVSSLHAGCGVGWHWHWCCCRCCFDGAGMQQRAGLARNRPSRCGSRWQCHCACSRYQPRKMISASLC